VRFFKRGPIEVLRRLLDVRDQLPTNAVDTVQPVAEVRALRVWESFDEQIIEWSLRATTGVVAGRFSGLTLSLAAPGTPATLPASSLLVIDWMRSNVAGNTIGANVSAIPVGNAEAGTITEMHRDSRAGLLPTAQVEPLVTLNLSLAAALPNQVWQATSALQEIRIAAVIAALTTGVLGAFNAYGNTAATAIDVTLDGKIVIPR